MRLVFEVISFDRIRGPFDFDDYLAISPEKTESETILRTFSGPYRSDGGYPFRERDRQSNLKTIRTNHQTEFAGPNRSV